MGITESVEEFLKRGGKIKKGRSIEWKDYKQNRDSRFKMKDLHQPDWFELPKGTSKRKL